VLLPARGCCHCCQSTWLTVLPLPLLPLLPLLLLLLPLLPLLPPLLLLLHVSLISKVREPPSMHTPAGKLLLLPRPTLNLGPVALPAGAPGTAAHPKSPPAPARTPPAEEPAVALLLPAAAAAAAVRAAAPREDLGRLGGGGISRRWRSFWQSLLINPAEPWSDKLTKPCRPRRVMPCMTLLLLLALLPCPVLFEVQPEGRSDRCRGWGANA
jgi:hypothetical protein